MRVRLAKTLLGYRGVRGKGTSLGGGRRWTRSWALAATLMLWSCTTGNNYETRPFFQPEYDLQSHGRKTLLDRVVETDPGSFTVKLAPAYLQDAPERIAVLPFTDVGSAEFVVDKIPLTHHTHEERMILAWTHAQRLRRAMQGYLSEREFALANLYGIDAVLKDRGIDTPKKLAQVPPQELGRWLGVDAVVYGEVVHYEAYYLFLGAAWQVGIRMRVVSTRDGSTLIEASGSRWDAQVLPALDLEDIAINSAQNILQLRDINLARAEEEACREIVKRIPLSNRLRENVEQQALAQSEASAAIASDPPPVPQHPLSPR
jgi:hypothetical protein